MKLRFPPDQRFERCVVLPTERSLSIFPDMSFDNRIPERDPRAVM
jgi:hypothetical protein